jgi:hypothetical protein
MLVKCSTCKHRKDISAKAGMEIPSRERIEKVSYRCSYWHSDMDMSELEKERECEGYEELRY